MSAEQSLREGDLDQALAQLQEQVRREPANARHRIFLFQLLAVLGQWDRALNQLNVVGELDAEALPMVQTYRTGLECEVLRGEIFAGRRSPVVFGEPAQWVALLVQSLGAVAAGRYDQALGLREEAFDAAPATRGSIDGTPFEWIADGDTRLGPVLEAVVSGRYYWIPFQRIRAIAFDPPTDLRDLVWLPAHFTWSNGGETVGLVPARYPGSEASEDPAIRLARKTTWAEPSPELLIGSGQRMLATDAGEYPLLEVRSITLETGAEEAAAPAGVADG
ncbi:type VI secretion system accessory protein TagJ [Thioalbus denitrificans]|uniref:Type VI secretion system protein ImpE n=1 Tax=Thioalbus denitrificans TaxID=547122 RepID=A0A369CAQ2_9GAMM|nr:type VI secretion system accessory protein TagJ [Thioalbus denitrificans]RCX31110.1 type VI secretion system protein ImpE [Thioalbus denitrificans]